MDGFEILKVNHSEEVVKKRAALMPAAPVSLRLNTPALCVDALSSQ